MDQIIYEINNKWDSTKVWSVMKLKSETVYESDQSDN